jgi:PAS domain S-box-containing protein
MKKVKQPEDETFFGAVFQNSMDGILISAPDGSILAANPVACRMLGRSEAEIIKLGRAGMLDPADARIPGLLAERERSGKVRGVVRMIRKDGSLFPAEISSQGYKTEDGNPRSVVIIRDITDELRAELLMRSVLSNAPVTIFATDSKGLFTLSAGRDLAKTRLRPGENVGVSAYQLYGSISFIENGGNRITGREVLDRALSGETMTLTSELNGVYFENHIAPITDENDEVTGIVGLAVNITDRKVLEMSLRKSEARYRMLFNHSTIPIWEADFSRVKEYIEKLKKREVSDFHAYFREHPEKTVYCISLVKIADVNRTALNYFGVKNISDLTLKLPKLFTMKSVEIFAGLLASLAEGRKQSERDIQLKTPDGKIKYMNLRLQVMTDSFFSLSRVIVAWIDISDRMNYEENLKKSSEALRELNRHIEEARENERIKISLNLHDDLGQKLTAIKMDISWLKTRIGVQSPLVVNKLSGIIGTIDDTVETVQNISSDLWPAMLYDLGLKTAVEWQLERFTKNTGIKATFKTLPSEFQVEDKLSIMLYRIIQESLTNVSRHSKAKNVWITIESGINQLKLTVRDNGIGIEKGKLTDPKSFGLMGLRERARAYGGELNITGKKGIGTRVQLVIPNVLTLR